MQIITWNVQWCRGCDGRVDPGRIARVARDFADFDVLCLQEVARHFPDLPGSSGEDQFAQLQAALPGFTLVEGIATDRQGPRGSRAQFGNAVFSRLPVLQVFRHLLPWPPDDKASGMQRMALEVVVEADFGPLRVTTTHLEYYSGEQRLAQVGRLRGLQAEAAAHHAAQSAAFSADRKRRKQEGPFAHSPRPAAGILAGDFNFRPDQPEHALLQSPIGGSPALRDAWELCHGPGHAPTVGLFDKKQWKGQPFCFDMVFVTEDLAPGVMDVLVNAQTDASDHQPVLLRLGR